MLISVVIPAHNEEDRLGDQLEAVVSQEVAGEWEVIVVDNRSTDGTAAVVQRFAEQSDRVRLVSANERADQSYAANVGVAASTADAVVFCDADDIVGDGWLSAMVEGLASYEVVTGPNELHRLNPDWLADSRGPSGAAAVGTFSGIFPLVRGNNYGVRREVWGIVGPLAEDYFPVADQEFSLRCWLNGIDVVGLPNAVVHYRYRQDVRSLWRQGFAYGSHRPMIARMLRDAGRPTPDKFSGWKSWAMLLARSPTVVTKQGRATWVWIAANRLGQVVGSARHRIVML